MGWIRLISGFVLGLQFVSNLSAQDMPLSDVLVSGKGWQVVAKDLKNVGSLASDSLGNVYFSETFAKRVSRIEVGNGSVSPFIETPLDAWEIAIGPDDRLYVSQSKLTRLKIVTERIAIRTDKGTLETAVTGPEVQHLCAFTVTRNGSIYFTADSPTRIFLAEPQRRGTSATKSPRIVAETRFSRPQGIMVWPGGGTLVASDAESDWMMAFRVEQDGTLSGGERYYGPLQRPSSGAIPEPYSMAMDTAGRLYVATAVGVQMFDPTGRLGGTILLPFQDRQPLAVCFGGSDRNSLFVITQSAVYRRTVSTPGAVLKP